MIKYKDETIIITIEGNSPEEELALLYKEIEKRYKISEDVAKEKVDKSISKDFMWGKYKDILNQPLLELESSIHELVYTSNTQQDLLYSILMGSLLLIREYLEMEK